MERALPQNLVKLFETFDNLDPDADAVLLEGDSFVVDGVEFVCDYKPGSTADRFYIVKPRAHVDRYVRLFEEHRGAAIFELGIAEGGSAALAALLAEPRKLVTIDNEPQRLAALDEFIAARGLTDVVRPYWGVDQADRARLHEIVADEFGGGGLDLVIDDASHDLDLTRASFDALFPFLRPGGLYVIEDWNNAHQFFDAVRDALKAKAAGRRADGAGGAASGDGGAGARLRRPSGPLPSAEEIVPLSRIAIELLLARASSGHAVEELSVNEFSVVVRRGPGELDPATFRLGDLYVDYFGLDPAGRKR